MLVINGLLVGLITQFFFILFMLSPMGIMMSTDALLTTLFSPVLILSLPLTVNELYYGYYPRCLRLSDMIRHYDQYTVKDFIVQMTLKENRVFMWPLWFLQIIHSLNQDVYQQTFGVTYSPLKYKEAMLFLSWGKVPLVLVSWIALKPFYDLALVVDVVLFPLLILYAMTRGQLEYLEDATYGMFDFYCNSVADSEYSRIWQAEDKDQVAVVLTCDTDWQYFDAVQGTCQSVCTTG